MCVRNFSNENAAVSTPDVAVAGGSSRFSPTPGCMMLTSTSPSPSDTKVAARNHATARPPTRPSAAVSPICAMPCTSVAKTSGAMIILIRRRNMVLP